MHYSKDIYGKKNTDKMAGLNDYDDEPMFCQLTLPDELAAAGRTFRIISTGQGSIEILEDLDTSDSTVTFMTKIPQSVFAVVYQ